MNSKTIQPNRNFPEFNKLELEPEDKYKELYFDRKKVTSFYEKIHSKYIKDIRPLIHEHQEGYEKILELVDGTIDKNRNTKICDQLKDITNQYEDHIKDSREIIDKINKFEVEYIKQMKESEKKYYESDEDCEEN